MRVSAAFTSVLLGLGFGVPCIPGIRHFAQTGQVWTFLGFPTYGQGPFERLGIPTSVPLLVAFLAVCVAEVVVGVAIWVEAPGAKVVALALLPVELVFWFGFALPLGPPLGIARTVLLLMA